MSFDEKKCPKTLSIIAGILYARQMMMLPHVPFFVRACALRLQHRVLSTAVEDMESVGWIAWIEALLSSSRKTGHHQISAGWENRQLLYSTNRAGCRKLNGCTCTLSHFISSNKSINNRRIEHGARTTGTQVQYVMRLQSELAKLDRLLRYVLGYSFTAQFMNIKSTSKF